MARRAMLKRSVSGAALMIATLALAGAAGADAPPTMKQLRRMHFPQPVRVGSLSGEEVIEAGMHLRKLGEVVGIFQPTTGDPQLVLRYGGMFGMGGRPIAPPLREVSLVGTMVKINRLDKKDLAALPTFTGSGGKFLGPNDVIPMGVDRKF